MDELEALRRERDLLKALIQRLPIQVMLVDERRRVALINKLAAECMGVDPAKVHQVGIQTPLDVNLDEREMPQMGEHQLTQCQVNGESRWFDQSVIPLDELDGAAIYYGEDVTHYKEVETSLKIRENRIKAILDNAVEGIVTINEKGHVETFNPAAAHIFGYTTSEVIGRNVKMLMPEPYHGEHDDYLLSYKRTGVPKIIGRGREVVGRRKDGSVFPMHLSVSVVQLQQGMLYTGIIRDLSEVKKMQDEVARARHMALIGEMAATIAHEIRNPLAGISGALQIICGSLTADDPHAEILEEVQAQVTRLSNSVNDLLMFTKKWDPIREHCRLRQMVDKVARTASMESQFQQVHFRLDLEDEAWAYLDPRLCEQILWNLFQNARDAFHGVGEIRITSIDEPTQTQLIIQDDGPGMPEDVQAAMFKPFFTTKTKGTGLGLPVTKRIMEAHGGDVLVHSDGDGTRIILVYPKPGQDSRDLSNDG